VKQQITEKRPFADSGQPRWRDKKGKSKKIRKVN